MSLWLAGMAADFPSHVWGTYRQWQQIGAHVRKGERATAIVFYKTFGVEQTNAESGETEQSERMIARASWVFNQAQIEGFVFDNALLPEQPSFDPIEQAERFAEATGAMIIEGGDVACYDPALDLIRIPERRRFIGTETTSPGEGYYSTLFHELVHWSGANTRLDRNLTGRFGSKSYAMEELVAELGAAFLCSDLGLTLEPRADHACYIAYWLKVLKDDKRAIFAAASKASQAANSLMRNETHP